MTRKVGSAAAPAMAAVAAAVVSVAVVMVYKEDFTYTLAAAP